MPPHPVLVAVGTRPEIIKMAPIIYALQSATIPFVFLHCGQHYDYAMSQQFIEELKLPPPNFSHEIHETHPAMQTASITTAAAKVIKAVNPCLVLVEGDTNTVLATAIAANKLKIPIGHIEAGLRSYDLRMPEEHNRRLTDHLSTHLYTPTKKAKQTLIKENVWGEIHLTGNTIIDAVLQYLPIAEKTSQILSQIIFEDYILATAHRQENVDNPTVLKNLIEIFTQSPIPIVYPIHPRTRKRLKQNHQWQKLSKSKNVQLLPPTSYFNFLVLMKHTTLIITDSGGIQEEATAPPIRKQVLVTRLSTERPEAVEAGFAKVVGFESKSVLKNLEESLNEKKQLPRISPYGDGKAAEKIVYTVEIHRKTS
jgi:UDP-N-acetylglucosamine 2-epimerase (non-hydrolysing)